MGRGKQPAAPAAFRYLDDLWRRPAKFGPAADTLAGTMPSHAAARTGSRPASRPMTDRRVSIRRLQAEDETAFIAAARASRHIAPWADPPADHDSFSDWLARAQRYDHESFLIVRSDSALAGYVNVNAIVRGAFQSGISARRVSPAHWGGA